VVFLFPWRTGTDSVTVAVIPGKSFSSLFWADMTTV